MTTLKHIVTTRRSYSTNTDPTGSLAWTLLSAYLLVARNKKQYKQAQEFERNFGFLDLCN